MTFYLWFSYDFLPGILWMKFIQYFFLAKTIIKKIDLRNGILPLKVALYILLPSTYITNRQDRGTPVGKTEEPPFIQELCQGRLNIIFLLYSSFSLHPRNHQLWRQLFLVLTRPSNTQIDTLLMSGIDPRRGKALFFFTLRLLPKKTSMHKFLA